MSGIWDASTVVSSNPSGGDSSGFNENEAVYAAGSEWNLDEFESCVSEFRRAQEMILSSEDSEDEETMNETTNSKYGKNVLVLLTELRKLETSVDELEEQELRDWEYVECDLISLKLLSNSIVIIRNDIVVLLKDVRQHKLNAAELAALTATKLDSDALQYRIDELLDCMEAELKDALEYHMLLNETNERIQKCHAHLDGKPVLDHMDETDQQMISHIEEQSRILDFGYFVGEIRYLETYFLKMGWMKMKEQLNMLRERYKLMAHKQTDCTEFMELAYPMLRVDRIRRKLHEELQQRNSQQCHTKDNVGVDGYCFELADFLPVSPTELHSEKNRRGVKIPAALV